jgi:DNA-binding transcriptional LysR family regulator
MTLDQLRILTAIANHGSILAAARALHRTQPTISVSMRNLEEELNLSLFDRSSYRALLTPQGELLCQKAREILQQVEHFRLRAKYLAAGYEPSIALAIEAGFPLPQILDLLRHSEQTYPETRFDLQIENIGGALDKVLQGKVDLAITPWSDDLPELETIPLIFTTLVAVATPQFIDAKKISDMTSLKQQVQIVVRDSGDSGTVQPLGVFSGGRHWAVNDHNSKKELILAGMGWGKLQDYLIADELAAGDLSVLEVEGYPSHSVIEMRAVRRRGEPVGPVAESLWRSLVELGAKTFDSNLTLSD